jgi:hypothetical protein
VIALGISQGITNKDKKRKKIKDRKRISVLKKMGYRYKKIKNNEKNIKIKVKKKKN